MATTDKASDDSLYPIAVLIDELKNEDIQVGAKLCRIEKWLRGEMLLLLDFGCCTDSPDISVNRHRDEDFMSAF